MIRVYDDFFTNDENDFVFQYCLDASYYYGETDNDDTPVVGLVHDIFTFKDDERNIPEIIRFFGSMQMREMEPKKFFDLFVDKIQEQYPECTRDKLVRFYINMFSPHENPYYHTDAEASAKAITFLYYPQPDWTVQMNGETQFVVDGDLYGVAPVPNRLVSFAAEIPHRATAMRDNYRWTVAIKYEDVT